MIKISLSLPFLFFIVFFFVSPPLLSQRMKIISMESNTNHEEDDQAIIQKIIERSEYTKYLFKNESELTQFSRSFFEKSLKNIGNFLREIFSTMLRKNTRSLADTNWLNAIMNFPLWEILLFVFIFSAWFSNV